MIDGEAFADSSAYIRVLEKKMLSTADCNRACESGGINGVISAVTTNGIYSPKDAGDYESEIERGMGEMYKYAYEACGEYSAIADIPASAHSFLKIKADIKGALSKRQAIYVPTYMELPIETEKLAKDAAISAYNVEKDPAAIDITIDRARAAYSLVLADGAGNEFISGYVKLTIDFHNLLAFVRLNGNNASRAEFLAALLPGGEVPAEYFIEHIGGQAAELSHKFYYKDFGDIYRQGVEAFAKQGHYALLEKLADNALINYLKQAKYVAYGPEVLFAYIYNRENEARQIRILAAGARNGLSSAAIRERLRDNYV